MTIRYSWSAGVVAGAMMLPASQAGAAVLFSEDFESLPLDPFVSNSESGGDGTDWTATPPDGWTQGGTTPTGGPVEFEGWTFLDKDSWIATAGNQSRSGFTSGSGTILVADPDEYDDGAVSIDPSAFDATIATPEIDISGIVPNTLSLAFDSSWREEDFQVATLEAIIDGGAPIELLLWESTLADTGSFKADALDEAIDLGILTPADASTIQFRWSLTGGNDWWWAIDNISVEATLAPSAVPLPATWVLLVGGLAGMGLVGRRRG